MSYEAGVLLLPKFTHGQSSNSYIVNDAGGNSGKEQQLVLPYDVPLTQYGSKDTPWVTECLTDLL